MVAYQHGDAQRMMAFSFRARNTVEKNGQRFLTVQTVYGTKYNNDEYTCDVDPVLTCSRDLWQIASGDLRTGRVTRGTTQAVWTRDSGDVGVSLFL